MFKQIFLISSLLGVLLMFSACSNVNTNVPSNESPEIILIAGTNNFSSIVKSSNASNHDGLDTEIFQSIINDQNITIPYVKLGETIQIEFKNKVTDTYQLKDYILKEDGTLKYEKSTIQTTDIAFEEGVGSFVLHENLWVKASSNSKDYEPGRTIRGFRLICNDIEYSFIIKTDADDLLVKCKSGTISA